MTATSQPMDITVQGRNAFDERIEAATGEPLRAASIETVQVNIGLKCNLACHHCHVSSSPSRSEEMTWQTMQQVLDAARRAGSTTLDITGGAPEMHPHFKRFVDEGLALGMHVIVRTNLTIMLEAGYEDMPGFFAERGVHLVASLPCYMPVNVDKQRGRHVFRESVEVIQRLNAVGYGKDEDKPLDLVYNPLGPSLPPSQAKLEAAYREALWREHGLLFNRLLTITNIPIGRFLHDLQREGRADAYQQLLRDSFNPDTVDGLMCRHQLHVGYDGTIYDCDFNYALDLPVNGPHRHIRDFDPGRHRNRSIATDEHCFACAAGCGSSCGGALA